MRYWHFACFIGLLFWGASHAQAAVDAGLCTAADIGAGTCTVTTLKTGGNEELGALNNRAQAVLTSVSGTNTITACTSPALTALVNGQPVSMKPAVDNTGAVTLNVCTIGASAVVSASGTALVAGQLLASTIYDLEWFAASNHWRIKNMAATAAPVYVTKISGASGTAGSFITSQVLTADATGNATTTLASVMSTTTPAAGTYNFKYIVRYQSAATTTGLSLALNYTGTTTTFMSQWHHVTDGGAAATGIGDQVSATAAGQLVEGKSTRTINSSPSATVGVDTANADMMLVFEGLLVVSSTGNIQLLVASEVAASAITIKSGTTLHLTKVD